MLNIHVSWKGVTDCKTRVKANFKYLMEQLLVGGHPLDIKTPNGKQSFKSEAEFKTWFNATAC